VCLIPLTPFFPKGLKFTYDGLTFRGDFSNATSNPANGESVLYWHFPGKHEKEMKISNSTKIWNRYLPSAGHRLWNFRPTSRIHSFAKTPQNTQDNTHLSLMAIFIRKWAFERDGILQ
jgi:hypothetical protein